MRPRSQRRRTGYRGYGRLSPGTDLNPTARRRWVPLVFLAILIAVGIGIGVLHNRTDNTKTSDPILTTVRVVVYPFQWTAHQSVVVWENMTGWWKSAETLRQENRRLQTQNDQLHQENEQLRRDANSAARLRALLRFAEKKPGAIPASVIGLRPAAQFSQILIDRGGESGVKIGQAVRTPEGVIGQVAEVSPFTAIVMLLTDTRSGVGAIVVRKGAGAKVQGVGIVQGTGPGQPLEMIYLQREDDIRAGDLVVTSGFGGVFPRDIPVGKVTAVQADDATFQKTAVVMPLVSPHQAREVVVLP